MIILSRRGKPLCGCRQQNPFHDFSPLFTFQAFDPFPTRDHPIRFVTEWVRFVTLSSPFPLEARILVSVR